MIDICFVAGRRPDLISSTLQSFQKNLFDNFEIAGFYANIDPIFGSLDDHNKAKEAILDFYPHTSITEPDNPNFCAAVRSNWSRTTSPVIFHLEDDWNCNLPIDDSALQAFTMEGVKQVSLYTKEKNWSFEKKGHFHHLEENLRLFGIKLPFKRRKQIFTTSTSFLEGDLADARQVRSRKTVLFRHQQCASELRQKL